MVSKQIWNALLEGPGEGGLLAMEDQSRSLEAIRNHLNQLRKSEAAPERIVAFAKPNPSKRILLTVTLKKGRKNVLLLYETTKAVSSIINNYKINKTYYSKNKQSTL